MGNIYVDRCCYLFLGDNSDDEVCRNCDAIYCEMCNDKIKSSENQQEKEEPGCPECGSNESPVFDPARELINPECGLGAWVTVCPNCKYLHSYTFWTLQDICVQSTHMFF